MTCAHIVDVALKKVIGVESVQVALNEGLARVKLKPGNTVSVRQLWEVIHDQGYTPKATVVSVRGDLKLVQGQLELNVSGTKDILALVADPKNPGAYKEAANKPGRAITIRGAMLPDKNLKVPVPLQVSQVL